jgi:hypothetical protein
MVRCAFAHNPAFPCWEVKGPDFTRTLSLDFGGRPLAVDLASLHGTPFDYAHIGGFAAWYKIRTASEMLIRGS